MLSVERMRERDQQRQARKIPQEPDEEHFDEIVNIGSVKSKRRQRSSTYKKRSDLPQHLYGCMGEANKAAVADDYPRAIELCERVIKEAPFVAAPYRTLGMVYANQGDQRKALRFKLLASQCMPEADVDWKELGMLSAMQDEIQQAQHFYERAIKVDKEDHDARFELCELQIKTNRGRQAMSGLVDLMAQTSGDRRVAQRIYQLAKSSDYKASVHTALVASAKGAFETWMESTAAGGSALDARGSSGGQMMDQQATAASAGPGIVTSQHVRMLVELAYEMGDFPCVVKTIRSNLPLCCQGSEASPPDAAAPAVAAAHVDASIGGGSGDGDSSGSSGSGGGGGGGGGGADAGCAIPLLTTPLALSDGWIIPVDLDPYYVGKLGAAYLRIRPKVTVVSDGSSDVDARAATSAAAAAFRSGGGGGSETDGEEGEEGDASSAGYALFNRLLVIPPTTRTYPVLVDAVSGYMRTAEYERALALIDHAASDKVFDKPVLWELRAECLLEIGDLTGSAAMADRVLGQVPGMRRASVIKERAVVAMRKQRSQASQGVKRRAHVASATSAPHSKRTAVVRPAPAPATVVSRHSVTGSGSGSSFSTLSSGSGSSIYGASSAAGGARGVGSWGGSGSSASSGGQTQISVLDLGKLVQRLEDALSKGDAIRARDAGLQACTLYFTHYPMRLSRKAAAEARYDPPSLPPLPDGDSLANSGSRGRVRRHYVGTDDQGRTRLLAFSPTNLSNESWRRLILGTSVALVGTGEPVTALALLHRALATDRLHGSPNDLAVMRWAKIVAAAAADCIEEAGHEARQLCMDVPDSSRAWNMACYLFSRSRSPWTHNRFLLRQGKRNPAQAGSLMGVGHHHLLGSSHAFATAAYAIAQSFEPDNPLITFCMAMSYLRSAMNRKRVARQSAVIRAWSLFDRYARLRGGTGVPEVAYNIGRAHHELGLFHLAVPYYQAALRVDPCPPPSGAAAAPSEQERAVVDIRREAAHNLACIYVASGAKQQARQLLRRYVTL